MLTISFWGLKAPREGSLGSRFSLYSSTNGATFQSGGFGKFVSVELEGCGYKNFKPANPQILGYYDRQIYNRNSFQQRLQKRGSENKIPLGSTQNYAPTLCDTYHFEKERRKAA